MPWLSRGWRVVTACGLIAACSWGLGFYGLGVYLEALHRLHGWPTSLISAAITMYYLVGALGLLLVSGAIQRRGPAPVMVYGAVAMGAAVAGLGWIHEPWQLFLTLAVMGTGWACLSTTGIAAALLPWFPERSGPAVTLADVEAAYEEQCGWIEGCGGRVILMASRALAACAKSPDDYVKVYGRILSQAREPVIVHWLGEMFDPALAGYWGSTERDRQVETLLAIVSEYAAKIDGVKISLLDQAREIAMRRRFPKGVRMYTGDDFDYPTTIGGDAHGYSDALLGIFDVIAPAASAALHALDRGDRAEFERVLAPTLTLSRHVFGAPTRFYKTGVVFAAWLNGHQSHFRMVGGLESARSIVHLAEQFRLMDAAGLLRDPELAAARMRHALALAGIE